jgi:outer membrane receptor protein involved in Fe transport
MVLALPLAGAAQTETGRITGVVVDSTGAVLPGVSVTLTGEAAVQIRSAVTDGQGRYVFEDVPVGTYEISFQLAGLATQTLKAVVTSGQTVTLEATLSLSGVEEIVQVTGTLIPRPALEGMSPVTTLDVETITYRGLTRVEDLLISLPQVFAAQNSTIANGASGTATVDLRYLGTDRTLVLIDGRRMSSGDAFETAPDLNFIPSALVKRVDVLTGGASSVYGADAVAGVVNFVMDRDFEGIRGGIQFGAYQHNNSNELAASMNEARGFDYPTGSTWNQAPFDFNVALGGRFADRKGHAAAYLDYRTMDAITKDARDYTNCAGAMYPDGPRCGGSGTWQGGWFSVDAADGESYKNYVIDPATGQMRLRTGSDVYNYAPANFMQRPDTRWAGGGFLTYEWNRYATGYAEVMVMDDYTDAQIAPSGDFGNTTLLNCDNPMLNAEQRRLLCTDMGYGPNDIASVQIFRRNIEGGGRVSQLSHTALRFSFGMKGDINPDWRYDTYGLQAEVHSPQSYANDLNAARLQEALLVDGDPNDPSTWRCRNAAAVAEGCVPWNIFKPGGVTRGALDYLSLPLLLDSGTRTRVMSGTITGDLKNYGLYLPSATEGIRVAVGGEYRHEKLFIDPDLANRLMLGAGQGSPTLPVEGDYDVKELFTEALVPLVQDSPGIQDLSLELGYRYSDYSSTGGWPTYKLQASWAPSRDMKVRAGFNRATRSPNVVELFTSESIGLGGSQDLCAGDQPSATQAQCVLMGVPADRYGRVQENPAGQYNTWEGGNPDLTPEVADTITAGLVVTPQRFPGFTAALDFYNIKIEDTIGSLGPEDIQNQCAATGNPVLCGLIHRDSRYTLWATPDGYTITNNQNVGKLESQGMDITATFMKTVDYGTFTVNLISTYLMNSKIDTGLYSYDCVGLFGEQCGVPTPTWRHITRFAWDTNFNTTFTLGWRMIGSVKNDDTSDNPAIGELAADNIELLKANGNFEYPTFNYIDVGVTYQLAQNYRLAFGVNNLFDKEPPLSPGMQDNDYGPGWYGTYDPMGRYIFSGIQFTF